MIYAAFVVGCRSWMVSWQERQTTRVLRRIWAMSAAQAGWAGPGGPSWARPRTWCTCIASGCSHLSHLPRRSRAVSSLTG